MPKIDVQPTATAEWLALVQSAVTTSGTRLEEPLEAYLVFLLMRFTDRPVGQQPLAVEFLEASQEPDRQAERLRDTGDECLLVCGLFPQRARRRRVPFRYYVDLGRGAYGTLAQHGRDSAAEPFHALADRFVDLMTLLQAMRAHDSEQALSPLDAAEMALQTGSTQAWERARPANATLFPGPEDERRH
jgi:hypothetical protein